VETIEINQLSLWMEGTLSPKTNHLISSDHQGKRDGIMTHQKGTNQVLLDYFVPQMDYILEKKKISHIIQIAQSI
jgi:hypothetical protein